MEQTEPKFNIGDKVKFVGPDWFYRDMIVEVTAVLYDDDFQEYYYSHGLSKMDFWEHALELVERKA